mgnify:CR=1 FL=1
MIKPWRDCQSQYNKTFNNATKRHAVKMYPNEAVGIVVNAKYIPVTNNHSDPLNHFAIHPDVLIKYAGKIEAVIHSHNADLHPSHPSAADLATQQEWKIPFGIQLVNSSGPGNIIWFGDQIDTAEYQGRPYVFGVYDCFSVWRDYYINELEIDVANMVREDYFWKDGTDIYREHAAKFGFTQVQLADIQPMDIILIKLRAKVPNHAILYLGGGEGLHHLPFKLSQKEDISKYVKPDTPLFDSVWRHTK